MAENSIICPKCGTEINLDEIALHKYEEEVKKNTARLEKEFNEKFAQKEEEIKKEMWVKALSAAEKKQKEELEKRELESKDLRLQLEEMQKKREEAMKNELELRKKARELEDKAKEMEIENLRKLDEERKKIEEVLKQQQEKLLMEKMEKMQEENRKMLLEKDKQMEILQKSLAEANRKAAQWSQQIQGEIQENELKEVLQRQFPMDEVSDVPTGIRGADLIHTVRDNFWQSAGIILWESKNTKAFSHDWIKKLKDDRVHTKASVCIIITNTMPEGMKHFGLIDDVWVCEFSYFLPLTVALRDKIISLYNANKSLVGKEEKMELLYNYLSSAEFKSKIENIIEAFKSMKEDLESEKRSMQRIWSKREKELERIINNTSYLYGDMQGIMGKNLKTIEFLELWAGEID